MLVRKNKSSATSAKFHIETKTYFTDSTITQTQRSQKWLHFLFFMFRSPWSEAYRSEKGAYFAKQIGTDTKVNGWLRSVPAYTIEQKFPFLFSFGSNHRPQTIVNKMTRSIRKQFQDAKDRQVRLKDLDQKKEEDFILFKLGHNVRTVMRKTGLGSGTVQHIKNLLPLIYKHL